MGRRTILQEKWYKIMKKDKIDFCFIETNKNIEWMTC